MEIFFRTVHFFDITMTWDPGNAFVIWSSNEVEVVYFYDNAYWTVDIFKACWKQSEWLKSEYCDMTIVSHINCVLNCFNSMTKASAAAVKVHLSFTLRLIGNVFLLSRILSCVNTNDCCSDRLIFLLHVSIMIIDFLALWNRWNYFFFNVRSRNQGWAVFQLNVFKIQFISCTLYLEYVL